MLLLRLLLGALFGFAGVSKLLDYRGFERALRMTFSVPRRVSPSLARLVPAVELALGGALVAGVTLRAAAFSTEILLALFTFVLARAWWQGRRSLRCACFGGRGEEQATGSLVARNAFLLLMGAPLVAFAPPRALTLADAAPVVCVAVGAIVAARLAAGFRVAWKISRQPLYADARPGGNQP